VKVGDLVRSLLSPRSLGVVLAGLDDLYVEDCVVHWFDDNDWTWELARELEVINESR